jgi:hypothetical protein
VCDPALQLSRTQYDIILGFLNENMGIEVELLATQVCAGAAVALWNVPATACQTCLQLRAKRA